MNLSIQAPIPQIMLGNIQPCYSTELPYPAIATLQSTIIIFNTISFFQVIIKKVSSPGCPRLYIS